MVIFLSVSFFKKSSSLTDRCQLVIFLHFCINKFQLFSGQDSFSTRAHFIRKGSFSFELLQNPGHGLPSDLNIFFLYLVHDWINALKLRRKWNNSPIDINRYSCHDWKKFWSITCKKVCSSFQLLRFSCHGYQTLSALSSITMVRFGVYWWKVNPTLTIRLNKLLWLALSVKFRSDHLYIRALMQG